MEHGTPGLILTLGALLLLGLAIAGLGRRLGIPQVTLLILAGMAIGPSGVGLLPARSGQWYPVVSDLALLIVGFLLGRHLAAPVLRAQGRKLVWFSLLAVTGAVVTVATLLAAGGAPPPLVLVLAGIAPASAPAAILIVVEETRGRGTYTETMLCLVAINNALALIAFDLLLAGAEVVEGAGGALGPLLSGGQALGGALAVGLAVGVPAAYLVPRIRTGEPMQLGVLGLVLACGGLALWLEASYLLAAIALGAVLTNAPSTDQRPFETVEHLDWPFLVLFFILTGASAHPGELLTMGWVGALYVTGRVLGLIAGAWLGGWAGGAPHLHRRWMGPAILPQAGLALGMALAAGEALPQWREPIMAVVVASTVLFELVGPVLTRLGLSRAGEIPSRGRA
jgi:Kef-type K+ transport system membrane component KefB